MRRYSFSPTPSRSPHYILLSLKYSPVIYPAGETLRRNPWAYMPCSNILLFALCCNPVTQHGVSDCAATTRTLIESQCPQVFARKTAGGTRQKSGNFRLWSRVCRRDNKKEKGEKKEMAVTPGVWKRICLNLRGYACLHDARKIGDGGPTSSFRFGNVSVKSDHS